MNSARVVHESVLCRHHPGFLSGQTESLVNPSPADYSVDVVGQADHSSLDGAGVIGPQ